MFICYFRLNKKYMYNPQVKIKNNFNITTDLNCMPLVLSLRSEPALPFESDEETDSTSRSIELVDI